MAGRRKRQGAEGFHGEHAAQSNDYAVWHWCLMSGGIPVEAFQLEDCTMVNRKDTQQVAWTINENLCY